MNILVQIFRKLRDFFILVFLCKGNRTSFLRRMGARIGKNCDIYTRTGLFGTEPWLIEIGDDVTVCAEVTFLTHDGASRLFRKQCADMNAIYGNRFGTIRILDNSFIATNSTLLPGITIGPNSVVGACSVVTRDVPPGMVVAGNPAKVICSLEEYIERYRAKMIPVSATNRRELREELTIRFWKEIR